MSAHFLRTAEKSTDVSIEDGIEGLTDWPRCRLLLNQEEKELAMRPVLSWHFPLHASSTCVSTLFVSICFQIGGTWLKNKQATVKNPRSRERHKMFKEVSRACRPGFTRKKTMGFRTPPPYFFPFISLTTSLPFCHSPFTVREKVMHFLAQQIQGNVTT